MSLSFQQRKFDREFLLRFLGRLLLFHDLLFPTLFFILLALVAHDIPPLRVVVPNPDSNYAARLALLR